MDLCGAGKFLGRDPGPSDGGHRPDEAELDAEGKEPAPVEPDEALDEVVEVPIEPIRGDRARIAGPRGRHARGAPGRARGAMAGPPGTGPAPPRRPPAPRDPRASARTCPRGSRTWSLGSAPVRAVPIWWAEVMKSRFGATSRRASRRRKPSKWSPA